MADMAMPTKLQFCMACHDKRHMETVRNGEVLLGVTNILRHCGAHAQGSMVLDSASTPAP